MISCHDVLSYHDVISYHEMTSFHDMVSFHHMMSCQDTMPRHYIMSRHTIIISRRDIICWHDITSWHDTWYHVMTWYHFPAWHHVMTCYHIKIWYRVITRCRVKKWYHVVTWFHIMTWYLRNQGPWTGSPSELMSSYSRDLRLHPSYTALGYLNALLLFYFNEFVGLYRFSRIAGVESAVWALAHISYHMISFRLKCLSEFWTEQRITPISLWLKWLPWSAATSKSFAERLGPGRTYSLCLMRTMTLLGKSEMSSSCHLLWGTSTTRRCMTLSITKINNPKRRKCDAPIRRQH